MMIDRQTLDFNFEAKMGSNSFCLDNAHKSIDFEKFHQNSSMTLSRSSKTSAFPTRTSQINQIYKKIIDQKPLQFSIEAVKSKYDPLKMVLYGEDCIYVGDLQGVKPHGSGQVYFTNGSYLEALFKDGEIESQDALMIEGNGNYYRGGFKDSAQTGIGILKSSGSEWRGRFISGKLEGNGELFFEDGKVYKGQFSHGKMDGKGCLHFKNGDIFEGYFKQGRISGVGTMKTSKYEYYGPFVDDMKEGKGTLVMLNGDKFQGWFERDKLNGYGQLHRKTGQLSKKKYQLQQIEKLLI